MTLFPNETHAYKTIIYMTTPEEFTFKESEIPLTITTKAPHDGYKAGITLDPLIKRYLFHMHMFNCSCDLPENDPTEVYFTEFVPESFEIPTLDITSGVVLANQNEYTHLYLEYTYKHLSTFYDSYASGTSRNYVFRII